MTFDSHLIAGQLAGVLEFLGTIPYILSILQKKARPSRVTWFLWTIAGIIIFASYFAVGARESLWQPGVAVLGNLIILILALKYGVGGTTKLDMFCFFGAFLSLLFWYISGNPLNGLITILCVGFLGALPTLYKSYVSPETEDISTWTIWFLSNAFNVYAIKVWSFGVAVYPVYGFLSIGAIMLILFFRRGYKKLLPQ